jgi:ribosome-binding factor A
VAAAATGAKYAGDADPYRKPEDDDIDAADDADVAAAGGSEADGADARA